MEINYLQQEYLFVYLLNISSMVIRLKQSGDIWLVNCFEGCQHLLAKKKVKISQIKKIIITDNNIHNFSGLLGLLSSISLKTQTNQIDIYGPENLYKYVFWGRKYSQTNFRYKLYIHTILNNLVIQQINCNIYFFNHKCNIITYILLLSEIPGPFGLNNAIKYKIPFGPLYGYLKLGYHFILPDGFVMYSQNFLSGYYLGSKLFLHANKPMQNNSRQMLNNYYYLLYCS